MKYQILLAGLLLLAFFIPHVPAFEVRNGDNVVINSPISDDLMVSGSAVTINAPVKSVTFCGGKLTINAPVEGNLIAAGGQITVNAPVGTDIIAAGGSIEINGDVEGKVLAAGGRVSMNGKASNIAISGGTVDMGEKSHVSGDAMISVAGHTTAGMVAGRSQTKGEKGGFGPSFDLEKAGNLISVILMGLSVLFTAGLLILGIILVHLIPDPFRTVVSCVKRKTLLSFVSGLSGIIITILLILILLITLVGIPIAILIGLSLGIGLLLSTLFSGTVVGYFIAEKTGHEISLARAFVLGFLLLQILFLIPVLGFILKLIAVFIGLGALFMTLWETVESGI